MQLKPKEYFSVVRQLDDPFDSGTYYVQAKVRNARTDALIATLNLEDTGNQRHRYNWQVPEDPSGEGFYIDIETLVYTDSGYSTLSENYRKENSVHLIQERAVPPFGQGGGDMGGPDIDYKRLGEMMRGAVKEGRPAPTKAEKVDLKGLETRLIKAISSVGDAIDGISIPDSTPELKALKTAISEAKDAIEAKIDAIPPPEEVDLDPVITRIDKAEKTLGARFDGIAEDVGTIVKKAVGGITKGIADLVKFWNDMPFVPIIPKLEKTKVQKTTVKEPKEETAPTPQPPRRIRPGSMRGFVGIEIAALLAVVMTGAVFVAFTFFHDKPEGQIDPEAAYVDNTDGHLDGDPQLGDSVGSLDAWNTTTTPATAVTQRIFGRAVRITGLNNCDTIDTSANGTLTCGTDATGGGGGGSGTVGTSSQETAGQIPYWTTTNGFPARLGSVATGTLSVPTGLTVTSNRYVIGGNASIALDTGYVIPLQSTLDAKALGATTITIAGTGNQITSSAGAQDISANRTWTLSLPNHVIFPGNFRAGNATTTNATTTALDVLDTITFGGVTGNSWDDFCVSITGSAGLCDGNDASGAGAGGFDFDYSQDIGFGLTGSATSTKTKFSAGIHASSTSQFDNATSTLFTATTAWLTNLFIGADTIAEYIADTVGAMFSGNTETGITVTYQDGDNTVDVVCDTASGSVFGCLSTTDWTTFNNKENALTFTYPLTRTTNTISFSGLSTTSPWTGSGLAYRVSDSAISTVATGTISAGAGISLDSSVRAAVGGALQITNSSPLSSLSATFPFSFSSPTLSWIGLATSSNFTTSNVLYATGANTIGNVATGTLSCGNTACSITANRYVLGGAATLTVSTTTTSMFTGTPGQVLAYTSSGWTGVATTTYSTGLTYSGGSVTVNTSQNIATLSNLTTNGVIYTSGGVGTLNVDSGALDVARGGTGLTTFGGTNTLLYTTAADTLASEAALTYNQSTDLLTVVNASTTNMTATYASSTRAFFGTATIGTSTQSKLLEVWGNVSGGIASFNRQSDGSAGNLLGTLNVALQGQTADVDNSGPAFTFDYIPFGTLTRNTLAAFGAYRTGANTTGELAFSVYNAGTPAEIMRLRNNTNGAVGIGTSTPRGVLNINSFAGTMKYPQLTISDTSMGSDLKHWVASTTASTGNFLLGTMNDAFTTISTLFTFTRGGSLGVGTTTPFARLSVTGADTGLTRSLQIANSNNAPLLTVQNNGTTTISSATAATSTTYCFSTAASKGCEIIMEDIDGAGCTKLYALNGVLSAEIATCPVEN